MKKINLNIKSTNFGDYDIPLNRNYEKSLDAILNKLVDNKYVSKRILSKDSSNKYNIYSYDFKPINYEKTIVLISGIHGNEYTPFFGVSRFLELLCEEDTNNEELNYIKNKVRLIFVPSVNPWGFENDCRNNYNGVDLNRNSDYLWKEYNSSKSKKGQIYYKGESPFSEIEMKSIKKLVEDAHGDNLVGLIDLHNIISVDAERIVYYPRFVDNYLSRFIETLKRFNSKENRTIFGSSISPVFSNYVCEKYKIPVLCLEWRENLHGQGRDKNDMSKYVEFLGNFIIEFSKLENNTEIYANTQPFNKFLIWNKNNEEGYRVLKSNNYITMENVHYSTPLNRNYIINLSGNIKVRVKKACTLSILPCLYQVCSKEQSYSKCNENLWFEEKVYLDEGEHIIPIITTLNGFHTNYNEIGNLKRVGNLEFLLRFKTNVISSVYIENFKINLTFIPSDKGIATEILDLNSNKPLFPKDVKR